MNLIRSIFSFIISFFFLSYCCGQSTQVTSIVFNNISKEDGLSHDHVNDVVKDKFGFIWFGTNDGLCRYDAHDKIRIFKDGDENIKGGLRSSHISKLFIGSDNVLYVGTRQGGLTIYDIKTDSWQTFVNDPKDSLSISDNEILSILEDTKGRIWVGTENGLNLFDDENKTFKRYLPELGSEGKLQAKAILCIVEDNNGWIWLGTWSGGLYLLDINDQNDDIFFKQFLAKTDYFESKNIWQIYHDRNDNYWLGTHHRGLQLMTIPDNATPNSSNWEPSFHSYTPALGQDAPPAYYISDIIQDDNGNLWLATVNGISFISAPNINEHFSHDQLERPDLSFINHNYDPSNPTSIIDNVTNSLFIDKDGVIWISCRSGITKYNPLSNQFKDYKLFEGNHISPNSHNYFVHDNGNIWIASGSKGLIEFDPNKNEMHAVLEDLLKDDIEIHTIYSNDRKTVYISSENGITKYDLQTKKYKRYLFKNEGAIGVKEAPIIYMLEDYNSSLWLCSEHGLIQLNLEDEVFSYYLHDPLDPSSIVDNSVVQIVQDDDQGLWITTHNGFSKVMDDNGEITFRNYKATNNPDGLRSNKLSSMVHIDGLIYIGSRSGLLGYDIGQDKFLDFRADNENLSINSLEVTDHGIWGSSTNHLFNFDPTTRKMVIFDNKDGVSNSNYLHLSSYKSLDGNIYFGHFTGYTKVEPNNFKLNDTPPDICIIEAKILSKDDTRIVNVLHKNSIEVDPDHYTIDINFAALDYTKPDKMKFAYMLEGFDQNWRYLDKNGSATYTNLDHGEYTFKVKAANAVGVWNEEGKSLEIKVNPTLLENRWIQALLFLFTALIIYICFKLYTKTINKRNKALKNYNDSLNKEISQRNEIEKELQSTNEELKRSNSELEQFAYIASHDLQEPLRITGSFIDLLASRYNDVLDDDAHKFIDFAKGGVGRMGLLIKNLLTFSKVGGTVLEFQKVSLKHIVEEKLLDLSRLIKEKNASIHLGVLPEIYCEKSQMSMLFYNLINNAIKFNDNPNPIINISSKVSFDKDFYSFYVSDNGIGIEPQNQEKIFEIFKRLHDRDAYEGTGIGLALCKKIITRHGGQIRVDSEINKGTTFTFTISKNLDTALETPKQELEGNSITVSLSKPLTPYELEN